MFDEYHAATRPKVNNLLELFISFWDWSRRLWGEAGGFIWSKGVDLGERDWSPLDLPQKCRWRGLCVILERDKPMTEWRERRRRTRWWRRRRRGGEGKRVNVCGGMEALRVRVSFSFRSRFGYLYLIVSSVFYCFVYINIHILSFRVN